MSDNPIFLKLQRDILEVMKDVHKELERIKFILTDIRYNTKEKEDNK